MAKSGSAQVLEALKQNGPQTARELASRLGLGAVVIRAHLRGLLSRGLVTHETARQRVGRPTRRFRLTAAAAPHFPQQYAQIASRFADALVTEGGPAALERTFSRWEDELYQHLDRALPRDPGARLGALTEHQSRHGFMASIQADGAGPSLIERNCPIAELAVQHPEICRHEAALFARLTGRSVELAECQALGDAVCRFRFASTPMEDPDHAGVPA